MPTYSSLHLRVHVVYVWAACTFRRNISVVNNLVPNLTVKGNVLECTTFTLATMKKKNDVCARK